MPHWRLYIALLSEKHEGMILRGQNKPFGLCTPSTRPKIMLEFRKLVLPTEKRPLV